MHIKRMVGLVLVVLVAPSLGFARGVDVPRQNHTLPDVIHKLAAAAAKALKGEGQSTVTLQQFVGPPTANSAAGIKKLFRDELEALGIDVKPIQKFGITGEYALKKNANQRGFMKITIHLAGETGEKVRAIEGSFEVGATEDLAVLLGTTTSLPANHPESERNRILLASFARPRAHLDGQAVKAFSDGKYAMEIWAYTGSIPPGEDPRDFPYKPRPIRLERGFPVVPLNQKEHYAVRLINHSDKDAAVAITVDGLNMYSFSRRKTYQHVLVPAGSDFLIYGWHITNTDTDLFRISSYAKSAAKELGEDMGSVGVISATFHAAWKLDEAPPGDELANGLTPRGVGKATERGARVTVPFEEVERHVGAAREVISVRYDR